MLTLLTKDGRKSGNAIIYGGEDHPELGQLFYTETDFGHHQKMTWAEIEEFWTVGRLCDYKTWRGDREFLHTKPMLTDTAKLLKQAENLRNVHMGYRPGG